MTNYSPSRIIIHLSAVAIQRNQRQRLIRELLRAERIHSQDELRTRLRSEGVRAEQATLSRDLHALGVVKGPDGYVMPEIPISTTPARHELIQLAQQYLVSADAAGQLVVLRTGPGRAQPLGLAIDNARITNVLGTIAGDDTIFIAMRDHSSASRLASLLSTAGQGVTISESAFSLSSHFSNGSRK